MTDRSVQEAYFKVWCLVNRTQDIHKKNTLFYLISYLIFLLTEASPGCWDIVVETLS